MARRDAREQLDSARTVLVAMDKFRGSATARELVASIQQAVAGNGVSVDVQPMSDGGEGFRDAFPGSVETVTVQGPLGEPVVASFTIAALSRGVVGVVEVAEAVGRDLLANPTDLQALESSSAGVGELILAAVRRGVDSVLVGCGGSATSDGGVGCYRVLRDAGGPGVPVIAATDVTAYFSGARRYAQQKGVEENHLPLIDHRLDAVRSMYVHEQGVDVELIPRSGAAGGIAGALAALGATLEGGFDIVARTVDLSQRIDRAALVITGEGRFDMGSLEGKVTAGVGALTRLDTPLAVICGSVDRDAVRVFTDCHPNARVISLEERFGLEMAMDKVLECVDLLSREQVDHVLAPPIE
jgi:glycerate kinase